MSVTDYLKSKAPSKIIAIEEHFTTPLYRQHVAGGDYRKFFISSRSEQVGYDIPKELGDLDDSRLRYMDEAGIDVQVLSFSQPGAQGFAAEIAIPMARDANDRLYDVTQKHPDRYAGFAALPTADPDASAREFERCIKELGFKGAMVNGHTQGSFLDEKRFWGIFEVAARHDVPVYLHPAMPHPDAIKAYFKDYEELQGSGWGFAIDTSCHFLRVMFSGVFDAYPNLKIILGHLGEGLPFAMHRLHDHTYQAAQRRGLKKTPLEYIRENLLVTTSGNWYEPAFMCTLLALGVDKILFAVDWPYEPNVTARNFLRALPISDADRETIAHGNAERVFRM